jgi:hypothetical protein
MNAEWGIGSPLASITNKWTYSASNFFALESPLSANSSVSAASRKHLDAGDEHWRGQPLMAHTTTRTNSFLPDAHFRPAICHFFFMQATGKNTASQVCVCVMISDM